MSRGPGTIQRIIIDAVTNGIGGTFPDARFLPLLVIADNAGYDTTKLAVRQSFARAARALEASGAAEVWQMPVSVPFGRSVISRAKVERTMLCVGPVGYVPSDGPRGFVSGHTDVENAEMMCWELFESVTDPFRTMRRQPVTPADA
jgi:hypothetical protein